MPAKILIVDDEKEICEVAKHFLEKRGFFVFIANNGIEAAALVEKEAPQIALLDLRLENESGLDILRKIKEIDKNIIAVMVTALADDESIRQAKALGADDYITKPFTADYLNEFLQKKIKSLRDTLPISLKGVPTSGGKDG